MRTVAIAMAALVGVAGLACRSTYYAAWERLGYEKRHLLADRVEEGREAQQEAQEQFVSTLERFKALTGFDGGELEDVYDDLSAEYERSEARATEVRERIDAIEQVAGDLFDEWESEIDEISRADLRARSAEGLRETRDRYGELIRAMHRAEARMDPVLTAFRDQVLFLKHNLNARAVASLEGTVQGIEGDVDALVRDMQEAIEEADRFLATMETD